MSRADLQPFLDRAGDNRLRGDQVQRSGGKFRPSLGPVTPDSSLVHQTEALVYVLTGNDIRFLKQDGAVGTTRPSR